MIRDEAFASEPVIFVPVSDDNPLRFIPYQWVTGGLIGMNVLVYLSQVVGIGPAAGSFGLVPSELLQVGVFGGLAQGRSDTVAVPEGLTLLTYTFFHADLLHLTTNMLFLWVFGGNIEDAVGHAKFLAFYLACGAVAGLMHAWMQPNAWVPLIGASGAVAGVIAAYMMLHPHVRVWVLAFRIIPLRITALWVLGVWAGTQVFMLVFAGGDRVAWWAHIGGMLAGASLIVILRRPGVGLFDHNEPQPARAAMLGHAVPLGPSELPWESPRFLYEPLGLPLSAMACFGDEHTASKPAEAVMARKTCDVLRYERRGADFALVRIQADGTRSELILTAANVVHLGMLAPDFSRRLLANKIAEKSSDLSAAIKSKIATINVRAIEAMIRALEKRGLHKSPMTEQRARRLAAKLLATADEMAKPPGPTATSAPVKPVDEQA